MQCVLGGGPAELLPGVCSCLFLGLDMLGQESLPGIEVDGHHSLKFTTRTFLSLPAMRRGGGCSCGNNGSRSERLMTRNSRR